MTRAARGGAAVAAAVLLIALIGALALTGAPPGGQNMQRFEAHGIVAASPADVRVIEIRLGKETLAFHRDAAGAWALEEAAAAPAELASHLDMALRFLHVATPARTLDPDDYRGTSFADFGLDPPRYVVSLGAADRSATTVDFGALNPAQTSQYVRLLGRPTLYLLPRHVGAEWQLAADLARRALPARTGARGDRAASAGMLLPASIDQVWAVEIVFGGKLHRFERDGAGDWFLHLGEHTHSAGTPGHVADPAKAPIIAAALASFGDTQIEALAARPPGGGDLARFGLERPALIALLYPRDSSTPLARVEIGNKAGDGFSRYAQVAQGGDVVTIAAYESERLVELLKAVGAAP